MSRRPVVAVIGGGISGLAAAHRLIADDAHVVLFEADSRLGGCLRGTEVAGIRVDAGPESLLARVPWGVALLEQLGLQAELVSPAPVGAHLWVRGALRPLPAGLMTGHARAHAIRRSGLLTLRGQLRAALDLVMPGRTHASDESVAEAIGSRLGKEAVTAIADPLLGGIYAGSAERLSCQAATPVLAEARKRGGSLLHALRSAAVPTTGPVFVSLRGGLSRLPQLIADELRAAGAELLTDCPVRSIGQADGGLVISAGDGREVNADALVLALPAPRAATLLGEHAPLAAKHLGGIAHAQVAIATLAFASDTPLPDSSGFLAARGEGLAISACTLTSRKWPAMAAGRAALLRCSVGRVGTPPPADDDELLALVKADLATTLGIGSAPIDSRVERFADALPQHEVGHLGRVAAIEADVARALPQVSLAGAWTRGIGIAACIRDGRKAAEAAIMAARSAATGA